jgi:hypothetical protein
MTNVDKRNRFDEDVFTYQTNKDGIVFISWYGKRVKIVHGQKAKKFLSRIQDADRREAQLIMAKATGNFKRGNERKKKL